MDFRLLGLVVLAAIILSGGAVLPVLSVSAFIYLLAFFAHAAFSAWQRATGDHRDRS